MHTFKLRYVKNTVTLEGIGFLCENIQTNGSRVQKEDENNSVTIVTSLPKCRKRDYLSNRLPSTLRPYTGVLNFLSQAKYEKFNCRRIVCAHLRFERGKEY